MLWGVACVACALDGLGVGAASYGAPDSANLLALDNVSTSLTALVLVLVSLTSAALTALIMRTERLASVELRNAKDVQQKLLPHKFPHLRTLELAGQCCQASGIGGDYYDLVDLGAGRAGLVLADVSGKGISAALLMANLHAILRSQWAAAGLDPVCLLASVNRLFGESTGHERFATLFLGVYEEATRRLDYVNCGHNAPLLLRSNGTLELLNSTATVLGLFDDWKCEVLSIRLLPGDTLVIFSDGASEASRSDGDELGQDGLVAIVRDHLDLSARPLVEAILARVREFSESTLTDDLTLLVARAR
jgi:serine phosphatase RsbU (regulator of sigma subunit)